LPDDSAQPIDYVSTPIRLSVLNEATANRLVFTKYKHWEYEEEIRQWVTLDEKSGQHYFYKFGNPIRLVEVIIGAGCPVSRRKLLDCLAANHPGVRLVKARTAYDALKVIEDENGLH
jgi:hypothetical protein